MRDFLNANKFTQMNDQYFGMYSDMHMVIKSDGEVVSAFLYLDLPSVGRKERRELEKALNENGERYGASVSNDQTAPNFLRIDLEADSDASVNLDRYLTQCDLILRPYGREMGLLCAYCRKEMQDVKPEYKLQDGLYVPVCPDCAKLETGSKVKKAENRKTIHKKRMTRGILGALIGCAISVFLWVLFSFGGGIFLNVAASAITVFLIKFLFEKMSRVPNRLTPVAVMLLAMFAMVLGSAIGYTVSMNELMETMRETAFDLQNVYSDPEYMAYVNDVQNGLYAPITLSDTFSDKAFYQSLVIPAIAVALVSFGVDNLNFKSRKRR